MLRPVYHLFESTVQAVLLFGHKQKVNTAYEIRNCLEVGLKDMQNSILGLFAKCCLSSNGKVFITLELQMMIYAGVSAKHTDICYVNMVHRLCSTSMSHLLSILWYIVALLKNLQLWWVGCCTLPVGNFSNTWLIVQSWFQRKAKLHSAAGRQYINPCEWHTTKLSWCKACYYSRGTMKCMQSKI